MSWLLVLMLTNVARAEDANAAVVRKIVEFDARVRECDTPDNRGCVNRLINESFAYWKENLKTFDARLENRFNTPRLRQLSEKLTNAAIKFDQKQCEAEAAFRKRQEEINEQLVRCLISRHTDFILLMNEFLQLGKAPTALNRAEDVEKPIFDGYVACTKLRSSFDDQRKCFRGSWEKMQELFAEIWQIRLERLIKQGGDTYEKAYQSQKAFLEYRYLLCELTAEYRKDDEKDAEGADLFRDVCRFRATFERFTEAIFVARARGTMPRFKTDRIR